MRPQYGIVGEESRGRVDFAIKEAEDLICITEDKQHKVPVGIAQNIKQLKSACRDWHFLLYSPGKISKDTEN
ncbi:unnamed protein product [Rhizophagus irregularis]|nr:unnamed protein product [Rhizophagus irregularis]